MCNKLLALASLVIITSINGFGQNEKTDLAVLGKSKNDGLWLRWAPATPHIWHLGNLYGYNIERFILASDGELENPLGEKLNSNPIKPWSEPLFERLSQEVEEASAVQELLYGEEARQPFDPSNPGSVLRKNRQLQNGFGISLLMCDMSIRVAEAAGLFFKDMTVQKGKKYIYRISLAQAPKGLDVQPAVIVIEHTDEKPLIKVDDLSAFFNDRKVTLKWSALFHRGVYSAYYIEKSTDGKNFLKMSDLPYVHMEQGELHDNIYYVDSLESNSQKYYYRFFGITPFGETGPPSNVVSGTGKDNFSGLLILREGKVNTDNTISLQWEFPAELQSRISGYNISTSSKPGGPFQPLSTSIQKDKRTITVEATYNNTYFVITALDDQGREVARSFPYLVHIEDTIPPKVPVNLNGEIDSHGRVKLSWDANTDNDILGYRVFRSNLLSEEMVEVTKTILNTNTFLDSLNIRVLNKKVYYAVVAVDRSYNVSDYSKEILLRKPDVIPPAPAVFLSSSLHHDTISLQWQNSPSDDIARYELHKIEKEENITRIVATWTGKAPVTQYTDVSLELGRAYQYKIEVIDSAGNRAECFTQQILYETGTRDSVGKVKTSVNRDEKNIQLEWRNPHPASKCLIYRQKNGGPLTLYKTLIGNIETFADREVTMNNIYTYKIQPVYSKGIKSALSEPVVVKY